VAVRRRPARGARGQHFLRSKRLAADLVADAELARGDLVLEIGGGTGVLTEALAQAGARVLVLERDPALVTQLHGRFGRRPGVIVVQADASEHDWPDKPFAVVANLPFAAGTAILRRLLGDPAVQLRQLDAIVEWGLAEKRTVVWPSTLLACKWGAWYELRLVRRVPRACFAPPPSVDAAVLRATRRSEPLLPPAQAVAYEALLQRAFAAQAPLERVLPRGLVRRAAHELGFDPRATARDLDARQWARLYAAVRSATPRPPAAAARRRRGSRRSR